MSPTDDQNVKCQFCGEDGFDLIGLKGHIERGYCEAFEAIPRYQTPLERAARPGTEPEQEEVEMCEYWDREAEEVARIPKPVSSQPADPICQCKHVKSAHNARNGVSDAACSMCYGVEGQCNMFRLPVAVNKVPQAITAPTMKTILESAIEHFHQMAPHRHLTRLTEETRNGVSTMSAVPQTTAAEPRKPHKTVPIQVWADIDEPVAPLVAYLNTIPGVRTDASCQGTIGEGGSAPYRAYVMATWTEDALVRLQAEFDVKPEGNGAWGYVYPLDGWAAPEPVARMTDEDIARRHFPRRSPNIETDYANNADVRKCEATIAEAHRQDANQMLERIRASLQARLDGRNEGGDIEVMKLVDAIVKKEWKPL